jgi:hypothetical protein
MTRRIKPTRSRLHTSRSTQRLRKPAFGTVNGGSDSTYVNTALLGACSPPSTTFVECGSSYNCSTTSRGRERIVVAVRFMADTYSPVSNTMRGTPPCLTQRATVVAASVSGLMSDLAASSSASVQCLMYITSGLGLRVKNCLKWILFGDATTTVRAVT